MRLREDILEFKNSINAKIVAATKYVTSKEMIDLLDNGIYDFGENRVDSFLQKYEELKDRKEIKWHFIGHLQRNKCKLIINKIDCLHSLDSLELASIIEKERIDKLDTFIEVSINLEENKNGVNFNNIDEFVNEVLKFKKINLVGLMMMAIKADTHDDLIKQFSKLNELRSHLVKKFNINLPYISMGMSDDYKEALECGSTHVRLGRILWKN